MNFQAKSIPQTKKSLTLREKLLAHVNSRDSFENLKSAQLPDSMLIAATENYVLRRFEPKARTQISKKIKRAQQLLTQGKEVDVLTQ